MNWRDRILADWPNDPQRAYKAQAALRSAEDALQTLASLGHPLHIREGSAPALVAEWPRMVFHLRAGERTVNCQAELEELGPDWFPTMEEARHSAGLIKQYQRGGIFDKNLPANPPSPEERRLMEAARQEEISAEKAANHDLAVKTRAANRQRKNGLDVTMPGVEKA